ncbi:MAG: OadG family protein [Lachnospiraceae bacterium]|nr:OadG family protein [Lachnospiraceae bacterium]
MAMILSAGEAASLAERMEIAGLNTLLGMGMAFLVLMIIMFVIMLFPLLFGERKSKKETREQITEQAITNTINQIEQHEALEDDTELVAVITAAIAAFEGAGGSSGGLVIRSIRQRANKKQWQRA